MTAKIRHDQAQAYPLAPSNITPRSDAEYGNSYDQMRKKKRMKRVANLTLFALILITVILVFILVFARVKTPKVTLEDVVVTSSNPSGGLKFAARVVIKNKNFGRYKFDDTFATVRSGSSNVGQFLIEEGRARARSTKKRAVIWDSRSSNSSFLDLMIEAEVRGKVQLLKVFKRRKTADMNCAMTVNLSTNVVQNLRCL